MIFLVMKIKFCLDFVYFAKITEQEVMANIKTLSPASFQWYSSEQNKHLGFHNITYLGTHTKAERVLQITAHICFLLVEKQDYIT